MVARWKKRKTAVGIQYLDTVFDRYGSQCDHSPLVCFVEGTTLYMYGVDLSIRMRAVYK